MKASTDLANSFQLMMEDKLAGIKLLNQIAVLLSTLIAATLGLLLYFRAFRPLDKTVDGFSRVARGDMSYQVLVTVDNEVGYMTGMFNQLTWRLTALFQLTDRINQSTNLDEALKFVYEEFRGFLPIDWVGLLRRSPEKNNFTLERIYTALTDMPSEGSCFYSSDPLLGGVLSSKQVLVAHVSNSNKEDKERELENRLVDSGINSIIALPLNSAGVSDAVLVVGAKEHNVYQDEHLELLGNIGGQLSHSFDKTYGMESIEDDILLKPGKLNDTERRRMEEHPVIGAQVLRPCRRRDSLVRRGNTLIP